MKFLALLTLISAPAFALTVTPDEVQNKTRAVSTQNVNFRGSPKTVLTDTHGISVYTFDVDTENKSNCNGGCLTVWPPLNIAEGEEVAAPFGTIMGNNGKPQLTLKGLPLYYFIQDRKPGDIAGHYPQWQLVFVAQ